MNNKLEIQRKRREIKKRALAGVLDSRKRSKHFWDALLIENIDVLIRCVEDLSLNDNTDEAVNAIMTASKSADRLSRRIFWLNIILVVLGIAALIAAGYGIFFKK